MAKGRKLTTSRSERLLGTFSYGNGHGHGSNGTDSSELGEEDVWSMVEGMTDREDYVLYGSNNSQGEWTAPASVESNGSVGFRSRRRIPLDDRQVGGLSLPFEEPDLKHRSERDHVPAVVLVKNH